MPVVEARAEARAGTAGEMLQVNLTGEASNKQGATKRLAIMATLLDCAVRATGSLGRDTARELLQFDVATGGGT